MVSNEHDPDAVAVTAPTGAAAIIINGNTIHSRFRIPHKLYTFKDLAKETLRKMKKLGVKM